MNESLGLTRTARSDDCAAVGGVIVHRYCNCCHWHIISRGQLRVVCYQNLCHENMYNDNVIISLLLQ